MAIFPSQGVTPSRRSLAKEWIRNGAGAAVGSATYYAVGVMSQGLQRLVGLSAATPVLSPFLGAITVALAAVSAANAAGALLQRGVELPGGVVRTVTLGLVTHLVASGNFGHGIWRPRGVRELVQDFKVYSPSDVTQPGAFASSLASFPAAMSYASAEERGIIAVLGRLAGCHSCGRQRGSFIADHMPPRAFAKRANEKLWRRVLHFPVVQRFHPQCTECSQIQAAAVRARRPAYVTHFTSLRRWHLVGLVMGLLDAEWPITDYYVRKLAGDLR